MVEPLIVVTNTLHHSTFTQNHNETLATAFSLFALTAATVSYKKNKRAIRKLRWKLFTALFKQKLFHQKASSEQNQMVMVLGCALLMGILWSWTFALVLLLIGLVAFAKGLSK